MSSVNVSLKGDLTLIRQLQALSLPPARRKQFHRKFGRAVVKQSQRRIRQQRTLDGHAFAHRKTGRGKLLKHMMRGKSGELTRVYAGAHQATVTWPNRFTGQIARAQQDGITDTMTASTLRRIHGTPDYRAPATEAMAKALIKAGYRRPSGSRYRSGQKRGQAKTRRVSVAWIKANMTLGQAGLVLRLLEDRQTKPSWQIHTPQRPFFGLTPAEQKDLANTLLDELISGVKHAR